MLHGLKSALGIGPIRARSGHAKTASDSTDAANGDRRDTNRDAAPMPPAAAPKRPRKKPVANAATRPIYHKPPRTDSANQVPTLRALDATEHAELLLSWMQGAGGRTGSIPAYELAEIHQAMCAELDIEPRRWCGIGRALRKLLGQPRREFEYWNGGPRCRVWRIPPKAAMRREVPRLRVVV